MKKALLSVLAASLLASLLMACSNGFNPVYPKAEPEPTVSPTTPTTPALPTITGTAAILVNGSQASASIKTGDALTVDTDGSVVSGAIVKDNNGNPIDPSRLTITWNRSGTGGTWAKLETTPGTGSYSVRDADSNHYIQAVVSDSSEYAGSVSALVYILPPGKNLEIDNSSGRPKTLYDFGVAPLVYTVGASGTVKPVTLYVKNTTTPSVAVSNLQASLEGVDASHFSIASQPSPAALSANGDTAAFTIQPKTGLALGVYSASVKISGKKDADGDSQASCQLSFTVETAPDSATGLFEYVNGKRYRIPLTGPYAVTSTPSPNSLQQAIKKLQLPPTDPWAVADPETNVPEAADKSGRTYEIALTNGTETISSPLTFNNSAGFGYRINIIGSGGTSTLSTAGFILAGGNNITLSGSGLTIQGSGGHAMFYLHNQSGAGDTLTLDSGAKLQNYTGADGGAVVIDASSPSTFTMNGGVITGNTSNSGVGAGVNLIRNGTFIMNGGSIYGNGDAATYAAQLRVNTANGCHAYWGVGIRGEIERNFQMQTSTPPALNRTVWAQWGGVSPAYSYTVPNPEGSSVTNSSVTGNTNVASPGLEMKTTGGSSTGRTGSSSYAYADEYGINEGIYVSK
jgi:hypothetical protein